MAIDFLKTKNDKRLAYNKIAGRSPGVIFLSGFMADMSGTKATYLEQICKNLNHAFLRFDYCGHGQSEGQFEEGCIGRWKEDAIEILDQLTEGPQILVGSSMGGWIMFLTALQRKQRIAGLMGIASAPDFVEPLVLQKLSSKQRNDLKINGICYLEAAGYEKPYPITHEMLKDANQHEILKNPIQLECPIRLVHGLKDNDVPWQFSQRLLEACNSTNASLTLIKEGDHRLSKDHELEILSNTLKELLRLTKNSSFATVP